MSDTSALPQSVGIDAGGTQTSYLTELSSEVVHLASADFTSLENVVRMIIRTTGTPVRIVIGAAGAISPNGDVQLTNQPTWPVFEPVHVGRRLGCQIDVVNDMAIKAAGLPAAEAVPLYKGGPNPTGRKTVVTDSTGVNHATLLPDGSVFSTEGGHTSWQPADELEEIVLRQIRKKLGRRYVSYEQLIAGGHFTNLYDALDSQEAFFHENTRLMPSDEVRHQVYEARQRGEGIGPILTGGALAEEPFCELFMQIVGSVLGQYLRNVALSTEPRGGIYLTGGVMRPAVVHYLLGYTRLREAYLGGSEHNSWLEKIPLYLVTDQDLGAKGALALARA